MDTLSLALTFYTLYVYISTPSLTFPPLIVVALPSPLVIFTPPFASVQGAVDTAIAAYAALAQPDQAALEVYFGTCHRFHLACLSAFLNFYFFFLFHQRSSKSPSFVFKPTSFLAFSPHGYSYILPPLANPPSQRRW